MLELTVYGIVFGSIISLGAIGLTLVFGIIRFANFAHGDLMTTGAYVALFMVSAALGWIGIPDTNFGMLSFGWRMLIAFPVSMFVVACVAVALDRILYRKLRAKRSQRLPFTGTPNQKTATATTTPISMSPIRKNGSSLPRISS